jgi:hypothetical protein
LQDRMVKELRLAGVSSIAAANAWLPGFITAYHRHPPPARSEFQKASNRQNRGAAA